MIDLRHRIDGTVAWANLPPDVQSAIGAAAIELGAAWVGLDAAFDDDPAATPASRAFEAADSLCSDRLHIAVEEHVDRRVQLEGNTDILREMIERPERKHAKPRIRSRNRARDAVHGSIATTGNERRRSFTHRAFRALLQRLITIERFDSHASPPFGELPFDQFTRVVGPPFPESELRNTTARS